MEHNQTAADGTVYDNGYGICMIPYLNGLNDDPWLENDSISNNGYYSSYCHSQINMNTLKIYDVFGSHIVNRNVLLSNSVGSNGYSNGYIWTTAKATLMSHAQLGFGPEYTTKYDDGEANYVLPLFDNFGASSFAPDGNIKTRNFTNKYIYCPKINSSGILSKTTTGFTSTAAYNIPLLYMR